MRFSFWAGTAWQGRGSKRTSLACGAVALALPLAFAGQAHADITLAVQAPQTSTVTEGNSGTTKTLTFVATRSAQLSCLLGSTATAPITLTPSGPHPATAGTDFVGAASKTQVTLPCSVLGPSTDTFTVTINGDNLDEFDETFTVALGTPSVDTLGDPHSVDVTIADDDSPPTASVGTASVTEGTGSGTTNLALPVTLSAPSGRTVAIPYGLAGITATPGTDFTPTAGTVTISAGQTSGTISVPVARDNVDEPNETLSATLGDPPQSDPTYALGATKSAIGTITDDDAPVWTISSAKVTEGNSGTTPLSVDVSISNPSVRTLTVHYATADITSDKVPVANRAAAGSDYTAASGDLTFAPGETKKTVTIDVLGDTAYEADEAFLIQISSPSVGGIGDAGTGLGTGFGTIVNDDAAPAGGTTGGGPTAGTPGVVPGGTTTTTPTGTKGVDTTEPKVTLGVLRFNKPKRMTVRMTCPATEKTCRVRLTVFTVPVKSSKVKRLRNEIKLGSRVILVRGGQTAAITINLSQKNQKLVRQARRVKVKAYAVVSDDAGNVGTASVAGTLKG